MIYFFVVLCIIVVAVVISQPFMVNFTTLELDESYKTGDGEIVRITHITYRGHNPLFIGSDHNLYNPDGTRFENTYNAGLDDSNDLVRKVSK